MHGADFGFFNLQPYKLICDRLHSFGRPSGGWAWHSCGLCRSNARGGKADAGAIVVNAMTGLDDAVQTLNIEVDQAHLC